MTAAAVSPFFARYCSALVNASSLACCFAGDTPQFHFSLEHLVGERREPLVVVTQVEPPSGPPGVVRGHLAGDVQVRPLRAQVEHETTGAGVSLRLALDVVDVELAAEQVDPQILVRLYP